MFYPCEDCEVAFSSALTLETHIVNDHDWIPQLDGPMLENYDFSEIFSVKNLVKYGKQNLPSTRISK